MHFYEASVSRKGVAPVNELTLFISLYDDLSVARLRTRADFGSGFAGALCVRDAVITISARSGCASGETVGFAATVEALCEHAVSSAASATADRPPA